MKKKILLVLILFILCGCGSKDINNNSTSDSSNNVTLEANNKYYTVSGIDISECKYEDGYFEGDLYFNAHTTEDYVKTYDGYSFRKIYFDFIDSKGNIIASETTQNNYIYTREYYTQDSTYVYVNSKNPIVEVKVNKIVISKGKNNKTKNKEKKEYISLEPDNEYFKITNIDTSECKNVDGYYKGDLYFNTESTDEYVKNYKDYPYIEAYFIFIDSNDNVVGSEIWNYYLDTYKPHYQASNYVTVDSKYPIKEVKLLKVLLSKK